MSNLTSGRAVVFDLGGVLLRWDARDVIATSPLTASERNALTQHLLPSDDWTAFDRGSLDLPELIQRAVDRSQLERGIFERFFQHVGEYMTPKPETVDLLHELHDRKTPLYCLSNMPRHYIDLLESSYDFFGRFERVYASSRLGMIKPEPGIYTHMLDDAGLVAEHTWFIDDLRVNIEAAQSLGINGVRFEHIGQCREALKAGGVLD